MTLQTITSAIWRAHGAPARRLDAKAREYIARFGLVAALTFAFTGLALAFAASACHAADGAMASSRHLHRLY